MRVSNPSNIKYVRKAFVASGILKGYTEREIAVALAEQKIINPNTNKPYSHVIIHRDIVELRKQWQEEARRDIGEKQAQLLAEINQVKREAWKKDNLNLPVILKAIEQECELYGIDRKLGKMEHTGTMEFLVMTPEMRRARMEELEARRNVIDATGGNRISLPLRDGKL